MERFLGLTLTFSRRNPVATYRVLPANMLSYVPFPRPPASRSFLRQPAPRSSLFTPTKTDSKTMCHRQYLRIVDPDVGHQVEPHEKRATAEILDEAAQMRRARIPPAHQCLTG